MNKKAIAFSLILIILLGGGIYFFKNLYPINIEKITYERKEKEIFAHIHIGKNIKEGICIFGELEFPMKNQECIIKIPNEKKDMTIKTKWNQKTITMNPNINEVTEVSILDEKVYLVKNEKKEIKIAIDRIGNPDITEIFKSEDESIVKVERNILTGIGNGKTKVNVSVGNISKNIDVVVTELLTLPTITKNKTYLKCGIYSKEDNDLLDEALEYRIKNAGYGTRAGVVAALRFLTLEFPYQINYFYENGRLNNNTGGKVAEGEGRYYQKGLYLHSSRFENLSKIRFGPSIWGCPLMNWQDESGFVSGVRYPNGLDCSGFITWAMLNGGFNVGDTGAGDNPWRNDDLSDLGPHEKITWSLLESNTLKAGDIIATDGHIAMIGGIKDGVVYVAESTTYWHGVVMHPYTYQELVNTYMLDYVIKMDDYYQEEGNYTAYWE